MNAVVPAKVGRFRHSLPALGTVVMVIRLSNHADYMLWGTIRYGLCRRR
jgi:hypothetical protein